MHPIEHSGLRIAPPIYSLVTEDICPAVGIDADEFWRAFASIVHRFAPQNIALLDKREQLQAQIDQWHQSNKLDFPKYKTTSRILAIWSPRAQTLPLALKMWTGK